MVLDGRGYMYGRSGEIIISLTGRKFLRVRIPCRNNLIHSEAFPDSKGEDTSASWFI